MAMTKPTHLDEFFLLARAQSSRCAGTPSGDRVLDAMLVGNPTGDARLKWVLDHYGQEHATLLAFADWWLGGALSQEDSKLVSRVSVWVAHNYEDLDARMEDLVHLAGLGLIAIDGNAPARRYPWAPARKVANAVITMTPTVGSMSEIHAVIAPFLGLRNAAQMIRLLRPVIGDVAVSSWVSVSPGAACGLSWALRGAPYARHPSGARQPECRVDAIDVLAAATEDRWPAEEIPWTIDSIVLFAEFVWDYLQARYPRLAKREAVR